jgi:hypothetical protein
MNAGVGPVLPHLSSLRHVLARSHFHQFEAADTPIDQDPANRSPGYRPTRDQNIPICSEK